jgi:beta-phosphoglucomutase
MLKGILFDFDGTLADTMQHNFECWKIAVREHGREISAEEFFPLEGMKSQEIARNLLKECFKSEAQLEAVLKRKDGLFKESYTFKPYPGVFEFLKLTKDLGVRHAIVTAARQERLVTACPKEFLNGFDFVVTNETSGRGKPFPDPYESGLKGLGLKAADCLVIENAPLGVKAAKAAGIKCIAITSTLPANILAEADHVIERFELLFELPMFKNQLRRHSTPGTK